MRKILTVFFTFALLLCVTACNDGDPDTSDTSNTSVSTTESSTTDTTTTETTDTSDMTEIKIFNAKVVESHDHYIMVYSDDTERPDERNDYYIDLPEGELGEDFVEGDTVKIRYTGTVSENGEIFGAVSIPHVSVKRTTIKFEAIVTKVDTYSYTIIGTTEGYEREFTITSPDKYELKVGDEISVEYSFRGLYSQTNPATIDQNAIIYMVKLNPVAVRFFARIVDGGHSLLEVVGDEYSGRASLYKLGISGEEYQTGDFVEISYSGAVKHSYPSVIYVSAIRHLTAVEIEEYYQEEFLYGEYFHETDDMIVIGVSSGHYYMLPKANFEKIPSFSLGDHVKVIWDGVLDRNYTALFAREIYKIDENGNIIE